MKALTRGGSPIGISHSDRHRGRYLWLPTQSYSALPKNLTIQSKAIFVWYPKEREDLKMIHDENNALTDNELVVVRDLLRKSKHAWLYIRTEHLRKFKVLGLHIKNILCYPRGVRHCRTLLR